MSMFFDPEDGELSDDDQKIGQFILGVLYGGWLGFFMVWIVETVTAWFV